MPFKITGASACQMTGPVGRTKSQVPGDRPTVDMEARVRRKASPGSRGYCRKPAASGWRLRRSRARGVQERPELVLRERRSESPMISRQGGLGRAWLPVEHHDGIGTNRSKRGGHPNDQEPEIGLVEIDVRAEQLDRSSAARLWRREIDGRAPKVTQWSPTSDQPSGPILTA